MKYAIVDIETTGDKPINFKVIEIAIILHDGKREIDRYSTLVNPEERISPFIARLTGIHDSDVANAPKFYEVAKEIVEFTAGAVFVAHNVSFDYGVIRREYRRLGYDFRLPHLCTVQTSRILLPGHKSYGLKNITKALNIPLNGHHRAINDTEATAKLFEMLYEKDESNELQTFIKKEINPKVLHPSLDLDKLDEIPNKTGIYRFYNDKNELIYIGKSIHIRTRVEQHLKNSKTKKALEMREVIADISYELTGSELIALLKESDEIKKHQPVYNRAQRTNLFTHGLYLHKDQRGYMNLVVKKNVPAGHPIMTFTSIQNGKKYLEFWQEEFQLCQRLCGLHTGASACFKYNIKECNGACIGEEDVEEYNKRVESLIDDLNFKGDSFLITDKGRNSGEYGFVLIKDGQYAGYGFIPRYQLARRKENFTKHLRKKKSNRDFQSIIKMQLHKNSKLDIHHLD
ncbi:GIY-YIG nuclease family protein [Paracrocinitomix mangrovi]|uniref:exonuclease domain-containing protein n=1 Tax=Paracrocinitomix mangrovi TaxID=2862509 RepID=UPI001C8D68B3|nr:exonuclease domain-containing protein [Paracrocinitomix mangrovi]UKN01912.1 GIY-YIG nuclease family protein [Paracrocinitomix mangrovi]